MSNKKAITFGSVCAVLVVAAAAAFFGWRVSHAEPVLPQGPEAVNAAFGDNADPLERTTFWHAQTFEAGAVTTHVVFAKTQTLDPQTLEPEDSHATKVDVSAVTYELVDGAWALASKNWKFASFGSSGDAAPPAPGQVLPMAPDAVALLFESVYSGQGYTDVFSAVWVYRARKWHDLGVVSTGGDNAGAALNKSQEWAYTGVINLVPGTKYPPDLRVVRSGTNADAGKNVGPAKSVTYAFKGAAYTQESGKK